MVETHPNADFKMVETHPNADFKMVETRLSADFNMVGTRSNANLWRDNCSSINNMERLYIDNGKTRINGGKF